MMKVANSKVEQLRHLFYSLKPDARAKLINELERGLLRGVEIPGLSVVLDELRESMRATPVETERVDNPSRLFFRPVEPFIVADAPEAAISGRISRACLEPIWGWIARDLLPGEAKSFVSSASQMILDGDKGKLDASVSAFQDLMVKRFGEAMSAVNDDRANRRLAFQIGTPRGLEDVNQIVTILRFRHVLAGVAAKLPARLANLGDDALDAVKTAADAATAGKAQLVPLVLVLIQNRLQSPWQLIRLATKAAESDKVARVAATPYAAAVTMVLGDFERRLRQLKAIVSRGSVAEIGAILKELHDTGRGLRTEIDLTSDSGWGKELATQRGEVADLLRAEIESMPGMVRRLLRPRTRREVAPGVTLDAGEVAEAERLIELVSVCRNYAGELALSEITHRTFSELQNYLETGVSSLVDGLRAAASSDRAMRQSQAEAGVRFCAKVFGAEYASTLAKAVEVAAHAERRTAATS